jgi:hypothetical protein
MSAEVMISIICIASASMSILFLISVTKEIKVTPDKIIKIFGEETIEKIKNSNEDEIKEIIRKLPKRKKLQLKSLLESQDIRDVLKVLDEHIINKTKSQ